MDAQPTRPDTPSLSSPFRSSGVRTERFINVGVTDFDQEVPHSETSQYSDKQEALILARRCRTQLHRMDNVIDVLEELKKSDLPEFDELMQLHARTLDLVSRIPSPETNSDKLSLWALTFFMKHLLKLKVAFIQQAFNITRIVQHRVAEDLHSLIAYVGSIPSPAPQGHKFAQPLAHASSPPPFATSLDAASWLVMSVDLRRQAGTYVKHDALSRLQECESVIARFQSPVTGQKWSETLDQVQPLQFFFHDIQESRRRFSDKSFSDFVTKVMRLWQMVRNDIQGACIDEFKKAQTACTPTRSSSADATIHSQQNKPLWNEFSTTVDRTGITTIRRGADIGLEGRVFSPEPTRSTSTEYGLLLVQQAF
ncbi:hypothetical protein OIO90_002352 [Microbotryomycetes sp. JL221]|nr:hypothetical protein OIO90_002352 [Microbotryomycetes sp. JL221]